MVQLRCLQCSIKCGRHLIPYHILRLLMMGFKKLQSSNSQSLLKRILTEEVLAKLKNCRTCHNVNVYDCIKCGLEHYDAEIGVFACDPECYFIFYPLFFPILEELQGFGPTDVHPKSRWLPFEKVENPDIKKKYIKSTRVRICRNLKNHPFTSHMTIKQLEKIEEYMVMILGLLTGEFDGAYENLTDMTEDRKKELLDKCFLFDKQDKFFEAAGAYSFWPHGRGVFINSDNNFIVWINPRDHIKIISMEQGGNLRRVYERAMKGAKRLSRDLNFVTSQRMGHITFCPRDMGTGLKVSVQMRLPYLSRKFSLLEEKAEEFEIDMSRVPDKEHTFEIRNSRSLGITEIDTILDFQYALSEILSLENSLHH